jgi:AraC-like DNA-binding protein
MLLQDAPAFKILDVFRIKRAESRGSTAPRPWASIAIRLFGSSKFETDGVSLSAPEGSVIYIPEGVSFSRRGTDEELVIIHLKFYDRQDGKIEIFSEDTARLKTAFISLYEQWSKKLAGYRHRCSAALLNILADIAAAENGGERSYHTGLILRGAELIDAEFQNPDLTVAKAAAASSVSPEYFRALYKSVYGISPHKAIEKKRLEKALRLLEAGYFTVGRVAEECGFPNVKYFSALFRDRFGISPRDYKNKFKLKL